MKNLLYIIFDIYLVGCSSTIKKTYIQDKIKLKSPTYYANTITADELSKHLYIYASDDFKGRNTGESGQKKAVEFLRNFYKKEKILSPNGVDNYFQKVPSKFLNKNRNLNLKDSENVLAYIKGSEYPNQVIIISAHLDHLGVKNGKIYNGADDDGSGTVSILEIAQAFKKAEQNGVGPKRSILFLHVTGEEKGLLGSKYYIENPVFPLSNTVTDLNIDMIGRVDDNHKDNTNYIYLIGSGKLSSDLHNLSEEINKKYTKLKLDYRYDDKNDPNRFYYRSDHYNFAKNNIPVIFYFNGIHKDYHKSTDTPDKINYTLLEKRTKLIFYTAWEIANRKKRLIVDKK